VIRVRGSSREQTREDRTLPDLSFRVQTYWCVVRWFRRVVELRLSPMRQKHTAVVDCLTASAPLPRRDRGEDRLRC